VIIVTGASGMLGTHLVEKLSTTYPQMTICGIYSKHKPTRNYPNVHYKACDLKDEEQVVNLFQSGDIVFHCAAIVAFDKKSHKTLIEDNVLMTTNIVNAALEKSIKKLVHVSSIASLSREKLLGAEQLIDEKAQWTNSQQNSVYSKSKYYAELEVWRGIEEGLNAVIINPGIILGETSHWTTGSNAIIHKVAKGLKYYTEGVNGYVDVKDVVDIMILLMESDIQKERFVVVENNYSYKELFEKIAKGLKVKGPSISAPYWMSQILVGLESVKSLISNAPPLITQETARTAFQVNQYDNSKLLSFLPQFSYRNFDESIQRITAAYNKNKILP